MNPAMLLPLIAFAVLAFVLMILLYRQWTHPPVALGLLILVAGSFFASLTSSRVRAAISTPDHVAVVMMAFAALVFVWFALRRAAINDARNAMGLPPFNREVHLIGRDLLYAELICLILALAAMLCCAICFPVPLDRPASLSHAHAASSVPWYLLGVRMLLNDFDPWMALGVYPAALFVGLLALPWLDNRQLDDDDPAEAHFALRSRPLATILALFGFLMFAVLPICIGAFAPASSSAASSSSSLITRSQARDHLLSSGAGLVCIAAYFILIPLALRFALLRSWHARHGTARYALLMFLLLLMALVPIKMLLHDLLSVKYLISLPALRVNL